MNLYKLKLYLLVLFFILSCSSKSENINCLILKSNTPLFTNFNTSSKILKHLKVFSEVKIMNSKNEKNGRVQILLNKNEKGWVEIDNIKFIPNNWNKYKISEQEFHLSKDQNIIKKIKGEEIDTGFNIQTEDKIITQNYFITLTIAKNNINNLIKNYLSSIPNCKTMKYKKNTIYYSFVDEGVQMTHEEEILFRKNKLLYKFLVVSKQADQSLKEILLQKKILFSILK